VEGKEMGWGGTKEEEEDGKCLVGPREKNE